MTLKIIFNAIGNLKMVTYRKSSRLSPGLIKMKKWAKWGDGLKPEDPYEKRNLSKTNLTRI